MSKAGVQLSHREKYIQMKEIKKAFLKVVLPCSKNQSKQVVLEEKIEPGPEIRHCYLCRLAIITLVFVWLVAEMAYFEH